MRRACYYYSDMLHACACTARGMHGDTSQISPRYTEHGLRDHYLNMQHARYIHTISTRIPRKADPTHYDKAVAYETKLKPIIIIFDKDLLTVL